MKRKIKLLIQNIGGPILVLIIVSILLVVLNIVGTKLISMATSSDVPPYIEQKESL